MSSLSLSRLFSRSAASTFPSDSCFSDIFHHAPILFAVSTIPEGRYLEVNDTFLRSLGFTRNEVIGHTSLGMNLWQNPTERNRLVSHLQTHGSFQNEEVTMRKKNGEEFVGLFSGVILETGGGKVLFTLATEISQRKEAESNLLRDKQLLEETVEKQRQVIADITREEHEARKDLKTVRQMLIDRNRQSMMGQMISNIVHQWRQPLNTLGLLIQNVSFEPGEEVVTAKQLDSAMHLIFYMAETAEVFRSFLKPEVEKTDFSLNKAIARTILLFDTMHSGENIGIDYVKTEERITVSGSLNEFCQALLNVLKNSRDVLLDRAIPEPRIVLKLAKRGEEALVTISDNGGGITEDAIERLFDSYFTTKPAEEGTGIGLSITKAIIEDRMGGKVSFCNRNNGAEFSLTLQCMGNSPAS